ncbi:MAG: branched-chain amino acid ABC transporter permease [Gammaproteobacteria bacterium]|nr:branched-chain amino acid ABC transporter permease [Gammaproteobacteria bacterium]
MDTFIQLFLSGISAGCVYGLVAMGFVLIYKSTEVVNFSQGDLVMLGAFFAVTFSQWLDGNYWLAVVFAAMAMACLGYGVERILFRRLMGEPPFSVLMVTIGLGFVLRAVAGMIWGHDPQSMSTPYSDARLAWGDLLLPVRDLVVIFGTLVLSAILFVFFKSSRIGLTMQAVSQNQFAAYCVGIPVKRVLALTWALSATIAGVAGILLVPIKSAYPQLGLLLGIKAFAAAIVGGFGSLPGALMGGLLIGVLEEMTKFYIDPVLEFGVSEFSAYILLLAILLIRPQGLITSMQRKKV